MEPLEKTGPAAIFALECSLVPENFLASYFGPSGASGVQFFALERKNHLLKRQRSIFFK